MRQFVHGLLAALLILSLNAPAKDRDSDREVSGGDKPVKEEFKDIGRAFKSGGRAVGHIFRKGAKAVGKALDSADSSDGKSDKSGKSQK